MSILDPGSVQRAMVVAVNPILPLYAGIAPDQAKVPYAVYSGSSTAENTLANGVPIETENFEVGVWHSNLELADDLAVQVRAALTSLPPPLYSIFVGRVDTFDMDTRQFRVGLSFHTWRPRVNA